MGYPWRMLKPWGKNMFTLRHRGFIISLLLGLSIAHADNIQRYMQIAQTIPNRAMKADAESQTWARSARNILNLTNESIAETLDYANMMARDKGHPLFCLPAGKRLTAKSLARLIETFYAGLTVAQIEQQQMTVSQVALMSVVQHYPCSSVIETRHELNGLGGGKPMMAHEHARD